MEWTLAEEEAVKREALDIAKKKELEWVESHGGSVAELIADIEADLASAEREIQVVTSLQVDEVRRSFNVLSSLDEDGEQVIQKFGELANVMSSEREDIKDFIHLKEIHGTLEKINAVTSTAGMLLSLQQRHVVLQEELSHPETKLFPICEELHPILLFKNELINTQKNHSFSGHFELLNGVLRAVFRSLRDGVVAFPSQGELVNQTEASGGDWEALLDSTTSRLTDIMHVVLHVDVAPMMRTFDPSIFDEDERAALQGKDESSILPLIPLWVRRGVEVLWWAHLGTGAPDTESAFVEATPVDKVLEKVNAWSRSFDELVFNFVKDGQDGVATTKTLTEGIWRSRETALEVATAIIDTGHECVIKILKVFQAKLAQPGRVSPPEALMVVKWAKVYESEQGVLGTCAGLGFEDVSASRQPTILSQEGKNELLAKVSLLLRHTTQSLKEWLANTAGAQATVIDEHLFSSEDAIHKDPDTEQYATMAPVDFLELVNTQFAEVSSFKDSVALDSLLAGVQIASQSFAANLAKACKKAHLEELRARGKLKDERFASSEHRLKVACAIANDATRCEAELPGLEAKFKQVLPTEKHSARSFDISKHAFQETYFTAVDSAAECIVDFCLECFESLFSSVDPSDAGRAVQGPLHDVLLTVEDFNGDMKSWLHPARHRDVLKVLVRRIELEYIQRFCEWLDGTPSSASAKQGPKADLKSTFAETFRTDHKEVAEFIKTCHEEGEGLAPSDAMVLLSSLIGATTAANFKLATGTLLASYPDAPSGLGRLIASRRVDLSEKERDRCIEAWDASIAAQDRSPEEDLPVGMLASSHERTLLSFVSAKSQHGNRLTGAVNFIGKLLHKKKGTETEPKSHPCPACGERTGGKKALKTHMASCSAMDKNNAKGDTQEEEREKEKDLGSGTPPRPRGGEAEVQVGSLAAFLDD